jgi:hypothetical protein
MPSIEQLVRVAQCAKRLQWGLEYVLPQFDSDSSLAQDASNKIETLRTNLDRSLDEAFPGDMGGEVEAQIEVLRNTSEMLGILGYRYDRSPIVETYGSPIQLRRLSAGEVAEFAAATKALDEHVRKFTEAEAAREEAQQAVDGGVFAEWVERSPGRGALRSLGPFSKNRTYEFGELLSWEVVELFEYAGTVPSDPKKPPGTRETQWVVCRTGYHREVEGDCGQQVEVISLGEAASIVLQSEEPVEVEVLKWAKVHATARKETKDRPVWDKENRVLKFGGRVVRNVGARASNLVKVLDAFEEEGWPARIYSPLPPSETVVRDTVKTLNSSSSGIEFRADGSGEGIEWVPVKTASEEESWMAELGI